MKRALMGIGIGVMALAGAVAASQAQAPQNPQRGIGPDGGRPEFHCGPARTEDGQRPPQDGVRGRGPGGGRQGGLARPGGLRPGGPGGPGGRRGGGFGRELCALGLTEEQQAQIAAIHEKTRDEIQAVLTPEQKEKLKALRGGRGTDRR